jgi:hypothetical protein
MVTVVDVVRMWVGQWWGLLMRWDLMVWMWLCKQWDVMIVGADTVCVRLVGCAVEVGAAAARRGVRRGEETD